MGSWGALTQRAGAFAAEAGWQPKGLDTLKPRLRGGYDDGSGDSDSSDQQHGTFFMDTRPADSSPRPSTRPAEAYTWATWRQ